MCVYIYTYTFTDTNIYSPKIQICVFGIIVDIDIWTCIL